MKHYTHIAGITISITSILKTFDQQRKVIRRDLPDPPAIRLEFSVEEKKMMDNNCKRMVELAVPIYIISWI